MKRFIAVFAVSALLCGSAPEDQKVASHLQDISVTIKAGRSEGSGVIKTRDGVSYVWTAGHVVDGLKKTRKVVDSNGGQRTLIEFDDAQVITQLVEDGRYVGKAEFDAQVIRYSDVDNGHDLALLRVRKKNFVAASVKFYLGEQIPPVGSDLFHVGSLLGQMGANSFTKGVMSQHGRVYQKQVYDQTTCTAFPGSSGGGVYLNDGQYVGMLVRGAGEGFNLIVPVRRMRAWAREASVEWAIDDNVPLPDIASLKSLPIEDGASAGGISIDIRYGIKGPFRYWVRYDDCDLPAPIAMPAKSCKCCGDACKCDPCERE